MNTSIQKWYAIRVTYGREMKLKKYLESHQIESFVPMRYENDQHKKVKSLVPAIHNLIFIHASKAVLDPIKTRIERHIPIRYIIDRSTNLPLVVPDKEMDNFIIVAGTCNEQLIYLPQMNGKFKQGDKVRVIGGLFTGVEGEIKRIKRNRRVIVTIKGLITVATAYIEPALLEKISPA